MGLCQRAALTKGVKCGKPPRLQKSKTDPPVTPCVDLRRLSHVDLSASLRAQSTTWCKSRLSNHQHRRPLDITVLHIPQAAIRIGQSVGRGSRLNMGLDSLGEELTEVFASIRGHAK